MNELIVSYKRNEAQVFEISRHLNECSDNFIPSLRSYVNINNYSMKIYERANTFEAYVEDELIGLLAVYRNEDEKSAFITNVSVSNRFIGKGVATILLSNCVEFFRKFKFSVIRLEVYKDNVRAINFYKKNNFKVYETNDKTLILELNIQRNYNEEVKDTPFHNYAYNFDFDVMHGYMIKSFEPFFVSGSCLELGSFKGDFTKKLLPYFDDITCVEASSNAIQVAKSELADKVQYYNSLFDDVVLPKKYDNIILTHVLEHIDFPILLLKKINKEWLSSNGKLFIVCPNANALSRQIAVKMGLLKHTTDITESEALHGHRITYTFDTLQADAEAAELKVVYRSGIFFKALSNFQWDKLLNTDIISTKYLDGCFEVGKQYPDMCSSIMLICETK